MTKSQISILLIILGICIYNIYGREITTSGFRRANGTWFQHRVLGAAIAAIGFIMLLMIAVREKINH